MMRNIKYIACCLAGVISLLPLQAQNIIRPKIQGPNNLWVNSYNGVLFFEQTDFETQNSAMPMRLRFYYNSSSSTINYGYGLGFSMGFEMRYKEDIIGGVDIEAGDGRIDHFVRYGDDYEAPAGVFSTLTRPSDDSYLLTTKKGEKYFFDNASHRKVTAIEDRYGNRTTLKYQDTLLVEIKDAAGHTITFNYTDGLLTQASATFSPGKFKYEYDGLRRLRKRTDPMGNITLYDYSRQNKLEEIVDANGNKTLIAYNGSGMVSRMKTDVSDKSIRYEGDKTITIDYTKPNNVYSYYRWDVNGRAVEEVGLCCGIQSKLQYDDNDNVIESIDGNGFLTKYTYDDNGNILSLVDPLGYTEQYTYEPIFNQVATYRDKNGNCYTYNYDTHGNLISINGPLGFDYRFSYDEHGWLTMITDPKGGVTQSTYNTDGTTATLVNADGGNLKYNYDSYGRLSTISDAMGNTTSYVYNDLGRITKLINAIGNTTTATYDKVGNLVRVLDAVGNITAFEYNVLGNITSITNAMGKVTEYEYDGRGNLIASIDPLGIRTEASYNERNKMDSFTNGAGEKTNYDYDRNGNLIAVIQPNGNVISYDYDALNRLVEISDNMGIIAIYEYDGNGNCISVEDGMERKVSYIYDALNRKTKEMLPSGSISQYEYDNNGNLISTVDALGHITSYGYDAMNRQNMYTDANNARTYFVYDANGNLTRVTDAKGNVTTFSYDNLNHNNVITFANGLSLQYTYDELGRIVNVKDRNGNTFNYQYDAIGNLLTKTYNNGTSDRYTYDAVSRLKSAINKDATVTFSYDQADRLITETLNGKTTSYNYDISGGKRTIRYPSGMNVIETLNARNLISSIIQNGNEVVSMSYNDAGQIICKSFNNGIITYFDYNENGWLSSIRDNNNIINYEMLYDALGNITQRNNLINSELTESYTYDETNQLVTFKRGSTISNSYEYDLLGNRIRSSENGVETNYVTNNVNAYTSISGGHETTPLYDGNGNMINDDLMLIYDFNNKIVGINGSSEMYKFDALGRRVLKNDTLFFYKGYHVIEEIIGNKTTSYLYGNAIDEILQMKNDSKIYYYHTNHLGSTMSITDEMGSLCEHVEYDVYGLPTFFDSNGNISPSSNIGNRILFTGREYDSEIKSYYNRNRYLSVTYGRFLQKDPLIYISGLNDYEYVWNRPISFTDNFGLNGSGAAQVGLGIAQMAGGIAIGTVSGLLTAGALGAEIVGGTYSGGATLALAPETVALGGAGIVLGGGLLMQGAMNINSGMNQMMSNYLSQNSNNGNDPCKNPIYRATHKKECGGGDDDDGPCPPKTDHKDPDEIMRHMNDQGRMNINTHPNTNIKIW